MYLIAQCLFFFGLVTTIASPPCAVGMVCTRTGCSTTELERNIFRQEDGPGLDGEFGTLAAAAAAAAAFMEEMEIDLIERVPDARRLGDAVLGTASKGVRSSARPRNPSLASERVWCRLGP
jgi:hypothetical protein